MRRRTSGERTARAGLEGGFKESLLRLNKGIGSQETWNEEAIVKRAERLAAQAVQIWPRPVLPEEVTATVYTRSESGYSIEDHHLPRPVPRALFAKLWSEVLALDAGDTETFLENYVAYKTGTNFVGVVPQTERLKLALNMPFEMLHDARGLATDVTGRGSGATGTFNSNWTRVRAEPHHGPGTTVP